MGILNYISSNFFFVLFKPWNVTTYEKKSPTLCVRDKSEVQYLRRHSMEAQVLAYRKEYGVDPFMVRMQKQKSTESAPESLGRR